MTKESMRSNFSSGERAAKAEKLARVAENKVMRTEKYKKWEKYRREREPVILSKGLLDFQIKEDPENSSTLGRS